MRLKRYFFISKDMDDLERMEEDLEREGVVTPQIHLLTRDENDAAHHHHLHAVTDLMKTDLVHSTLIGAVLGASAAVLTLVVAYLMGWTETAAGWVPFIFLSIVFLGFFSWQGGLRGIQTPNVHFRQFEKALNEGKHVFFVDLEPGQEKILKRVSKKHPGAQRAGKDVGAPHWIVAWHFRLKRFFTETFP